MKQRKETLLQKLLTRISPDCNCSPHPLDSNFHSTHACPRAHTRMHTHTEWLHLIPDSLPTQTYTLPTWGSVLPSSSFLPHQHLLLEKDNRGSGPTVKQDHPMSHLQVISPNNALHQFDFLCYILYCNSKQIHMMLNQAKNVFGDHKE